jgi:hypothetical protein
MIRALRSRGVFAVGCTIKPTGIIASIYLTDEEQTGERSLVDLDTGDCYLVELPNSPIHYNAFLPYATPLSNPSNP